MLRFINEQTKNYSVRIFILPSPDVMQIVCKSYTPLMSWLYANTFLRALVQKKTSLICCGIRGR